MQKSKEYVFIETGARYSCDKMKEKNEKTPGRWSLKAPDGVGVVRRTLEERHGMTGQDMLPTKDAAVTKKANAPSLYIKR